MVFVDQFSEQTMACCLKDKIVLITGASSGIGRAIAFVLAKEGCKVALMARREQRLQEMKNKITSEGGQALVLVADVTDRQQVNDVVKKLEAEWGPVDILVNNAGVYNATPVAHLRLDDWLEVVNVNIKGVLNCIGATLKPMVERKDGHILNISSNDGFKVAGDFPAAHYVGSKFFLQGFSSGMRQELASKGIRVSNICPADVHTEIFGLVKDPSVDVSMYEEDKIPELIEKGQLLSSDDIADLALYMLKQPKRVGLNLALIEGAAVPTQ